MKQRIGLISDTHGLLRPEALAALAGSDHIVHAGDVGNAQVLRALESLAPVTVVRGNNDVGAWAQALPHTAVLELDRLSIYVLHDIHALDAQASRIHDVVVAGHSHRPVVQRRGALLHVNPGSAGPRRFSLPISVAHLELAAGEVTARIEVLELGAAASAHRRRAAARAR